MQNAVHCFLGGLVPASEAALVALEDDFLFLGSNEPSAPGEAMQDVGDAAAADDSLASSDDSTPFDGFGANGLFEPRPDAPTHEASTSEEGVFAPFPSAAAESPVDAGVGDASNAATREDVANSAESEGSASPCEEPAESKLAAAVTMLRTYEDQLSARVDDAEEVFRRLEEHGVALDAGYPSVRDFEARMLQLTPRLASVRASALRGARIRGGSGSPAPVQGDSRARRVEALATIARGLGRLRALDRDVARLASDAGDTFRLIETKRLFEECGYTSFEEFLERAVGESAVLATARTLAAATARAAEGTARDGANGRSARLGAPDVAGGAAVSAALAETAAPKSTLEPSTLPSADAGKPVAGPARVGVPRLAVSILLCVAATFAGALAGSWGPRAIAERASSERAATMPAVQASSQPAPAELQAPRAASSAAQAPVGHPHGGNGPREAHR